MAKPMSLEAFLALLMFALRLKWFNIAMGLVLVLSIVPMVL